MHFTIGAVPREEYEASHDADLNNARAAGSGNRWSAAENGGRSTRPQPPGKVHRDRRGETVNATPERAYTKRLLLASPVPNPERQAARRREYWQLS